MKQPDEFKDPTFTPQREKGRFQAIPKPEQKKKEQTDPDWDRINPEIISLCQRNGMARSCLTAYLEGQVSWMECLETMVCVLGKELTSNQFILVDQRKEYVELFNAHKALVPLPPVQIPQITLNVNHPH